MKQLIKLLLSGLFLILFHTSGLAQDTIMKMDRSQLIVKIIEVEQHQIKYKRWNYVDGPLYSINKSEIFMIIYKNGEREIMPPTELPVTKTSVDKSDFTKQLSYELSGSPQKAPIDTSVDYKNLKIKYRPSRIMVGTEPLSIGIEGEMRVVKNMLNLGVSYAYGFPKDDYIINQDYGMIYASLYAPLNRLMGNYKKQNKGLFVFGQVGYGLSYVKLQSIDGYAIPATSGGFTWRVGMDFLISRGFGISVYAHELKKVYGGIVLNW